MLDTDSARRRTVVLPAGCQMEQGDGYEFGDAGAAGRFLIECISTAPPEREEDEVLEARTGTLRPLPAGYSWSWLGALYARGENPREDQVVGDLADGAVHRIPERYADLDRPGAPGPTSVCPALRGRLRRLGSPVYGWFTYARGLLAEALGTQGRVALRRCDGTRQVLSASLTATARPLEQPHYFDPRGGLLTWDTAYDEGNELWPGQRSLREGRLEAYVPATARRREWQLPRLAIPTPEGTLHSAHAAAGWSTHTRAMVFWLPQRSLSCGEVCDTRTEYLYAATVPAGLLGRG